MKRKFFRILLLSFTLALLLACPAYADDYGSDSIRVDEALALQMGDRFFLQSCPILMLRQIMLSKCTIQIAMQ